jgi:hypothetical protein
MGNFAKQLGSMRLMLRAQRPAIQEPLPPADTKMWFSILDTPCVKY